MVKNRKIKKPNSLAGVRLRWHERGFIRPFDIFNYTPFSAFEVDHA